MAWRKAKDAGNTFPSSRSTNNVSGLTSGAIDVSSVRARAWAGNRPDTSHSRCMATLLAVPTATTQAPKTPMKGRRQSLGKPAAPRCPIAARNSAMPGAESICMRSGVTNDSPNTKAP